MEKNTNVPLVSIIVVNWNGKEVLGECLKSLEKLTYLNWELIIVDNGSTDRSHLLPRKYRKPIKNYKLIKNNNNVGFAPANNQGFEIADGEYILLLNNDTKVTPLFLMKMVKRMESDSSIGAMQPKIYMMDQPVGVKKNQRYLDNAGSYITPIGFLEHWGFGMKDSDEFAHEKEVFSCKGACMLIRREVIETVGLFDEEFNSYFEESDFCWRVWLAGWRVVFYPKSYIYHKVGFTIRRLDVTKINFDYYKNRIASIIKNTGLKWLVFMLPVHLVLSVGIALVFLLRRKFSASLMILKAIWWNVTNLENTYRKRKKVQLFRKVSDREMFSELMKKADFIKFFGDFKRVEKDLE